MFSRFMFVACLTCVACTRPAGVDAGAVDAGTGDSGTPNFDSGAPDSGAGDAGIAWIEFKPPQTWGPYSSNHFCRTVARLDAGMFVEYGGVVSDGGFLDPSAPGFACTGYGAGVFGRSIPHDGVIDTFSSCASSASARCVIGTVVVRGRRVESALSGVVEPLWTDGGALFAAELASGSGATFVCINAWSPGDAGLCTSELLLGIDRNADWSLTSLGRGACGDLRLTDDGHVVAVSNDRLLDGVASFGVSLFEFAEDAGARTIWSSSSYRDCRVWTMVPRSLICVTRDFRQVRRVTLDPPGDELIAETIMDAGWRIANVVDAPDPLAIVVARENDEWVATAPAVRSEIGHVYVQRASWSQPRVLLSHLDTNPLFSGWWSPDVLRVVVYDEMRDRIRYADFPIPAR